MAMAYRHPSLEEKEAYVQQLFDQIAENYDRMNQVMSAGQWQRWHREFVRYTGLQPGMHSLDVACGTGDLTLLTAAQVAPGGRVIGVDFSEGMLEVGRRRVAASPYREMVELRWANAMELPFPDSSFDCVTIGWALRNVKDLARVLGELRRVVKPGGRVVALEASRPKNPLVRLGFWAHWKGLVPLIDWVVLKVGRDAPVRPYTYLSRSLDQFPGPDRLAEMFGEAGLTGCGYRSLMLGTVSIHFGTRPE